MITLSTIANKLRTDNSIVNNYLFGLAGHPKLGNGLTVINKAGFYFWVMPRADALKFIQRVEEYRQAMIALI